MGKRIECRICHKEKKEKYFYEGRRQCIPCYQERNKPGRKLAQAADDQVLQLETTNVSMQSQIDELEKKLQNMTVEHEETKHTNTAMNYFQQITARIENSMQEIQDKLAEMREEYEELLPKVDVLVKENKELKTRLDMIQYRMDSIDEKVDQGVSVTETMYSGVCRMEDDIKIVQTTSDGFGEKIRKYREMLLEIGDTYFQFVMGRSDRDEVERRFTAKGYLVEEKNGVKYE